MGHDVGDQGALPPLPLPAIPVSPGVGDGPAGILNSVLPPVPGSPAGSSGHYEFDEPGFQDVIKQVQACIDKIAEARRLARPMTQVLPMGDEPSSRRVTEAVNSSGQAYLRHNTNLENFYKKLLDDLTAARDRYVSQEGHASGSLAKTQGGL